MNLVHLATMDRAVSTPNVLLDQAVVAPEMRVSADDLAGLLKLLFKTSMPETFANWQKTQVQQKLLEFHAIAREIMQAEPEASFRDGKYSREIKTSRFTLIEQFEDDQPMI